MDRMKELEDKIKELRKAGYYIDYFPLPDDGPGVFYKISVAGKGLSSTQILNKKSIDKGDFGLIDLLIAGVNIQREKGV